MRGETGRLRRRLGPFRIHAHFLLAFTGGVIFASPAQEDRAEATTDFLERSGRRRRRPWGGGNRLAAFDGLKREVAFSVLAEIAQFRVELVVVSFLVHH